MCGLFGGISLNQLDLSKLKLQGLYNISRGKHSCGILINNTVYKGVNKNANFSDFITAVELPKPVGNLPVIGHTRAATHGAHSETNAHPFEIYSDKYGTDPVLIGAHNGVIQNWLTLCAEYDVDTKDIHVDSHGLFSILGKVDKKEWKTVLSKYTGFAALTWTCPRTEPGVLYLFKGAGLDTYNGKEALYEERPLYYFVDEGVNFYYSSLAESLYAIGGNEKTVKQLGANAIFRISANIETGKFNISSQAVVREKPVYKKPVETRTTDYTGATSYNSSSPYKYGSFGYRYRTTSQKAFNRALYANPEYTAKEYESFLTSILKADVGEPLTKFINGFIENVDDTLYNRTYLANLAKKPYHLSFDIRQDLAYLGKDESDIMVSVETISKYANPTVYNTNYRQLSIDTSILHNSEPLILEYLVKNHLSRKVDSILLQNETVPDYAKANGRIYFEGGCYKRNDHVLHNRVFIVNFLGDNHEITDMSPKELTEKYHDLVETKGYLTIFFKLGVLYFAEFDYNKVPSLPNITQKGMLSTRPASGTTILSGGNNYVFAPFIYSPDGYASEYRIYKTSGGAAPKGLLFWKPVFSDRTYVAFNGQLVDICAYDPMADDIISIYSPRYTVLEEELAKMYELKPTAPSKINEEEGKKYIIESDKKLTLLTSPIHTLSDIDDKTLKDGFDEDGIDDEDLDLPDLDFTGIEHLKESPVLPYIDMELDPENGMAGTLVLQDYYQFVYMLVRFIEVAAKDFFKNFGIHPSETVSEVSTYGKEDVKKDENTPLDDYYIQRHLGVTRNNDPYINGDGTVLHHFDLKYVEKLQNLFTVLDNLLEKTLYPILQDPNNKDLEELKDLVRHYVQTKFPANPFDRDGAFNKNKFLTKDLLTSVLDRDEEDDTLDPVGE